MTDATTAPRAADGEAAAAGPSGGDDRRGVATVTAPTGGGRR
jgi:hypothetical protein